MNRSRFFDGKKIDVVELVNTISGISNRLDSLETGQNEIKKMLSGVVQTPPTPDIDPFLPLDPNSWLNIAKGYIGIDEDADEQKVIQLSEQAGTPITSSETPWCAIFVNAVLAMAGLPTTGTMRARDFETYGEASEEQVGAIVVYRNHVGFVPELGKVLGGNQSDGVNIGNQEWYGKPITYRMPIQEGKKK